MATRPNRPDRSRRPQASAASRHVVREKNRASAGSIARLISEHRETLSESLYRLIQTPFNSAMTVCVIAIALLLPGLAWLVAGNLGELGQGFQDSARITLYLHEQVDDTEALQLRDVLLGNPGILAVEYTSRTAALTEFQERSGFGEILAELGENPLPASLAVRPTAMTEEHIQSLVGQFEVMEQVDSISIDLLWIQRLAAMQSLVERSGRVLTLVLGLAVLLIVGNTIRTAFDSRFREIEVLRLVGGTDTYIARPFLYSGILLGMMGALVATLLIMGIQAATRGSIDSLLSLYGARFPMHHFTVRDAVSLVLLGCSLGWLGAAVSVTVRLYGSPP